MFPGGPYTCLLNQIKWSLGYGVWVRKQYKCVWFTERQHRNNSVIHSSFSICQRWFEQSKTDGVFGSVCPPGAAGVCWTGWTSCFRPSRGGNAQEGTGSWQKAKNTGGGAQHKGRGPLICLLLSKWIQFLGYLSAPQQNWIGQRGCSKRHIFLFRVYTSAITFLMRKISVKSRKILLISVFLWSLE